MPYHSGEFQCLEYILQITTSFFHTFGEISMYLFCFFFRLLQFTSEKTTRFKV